MKFSIESLLSARVFLNPVVHEDYVFFLSDLSDKLSLYRMPLRGGIPEPLIPRNIALQNPFLVGTDPFFLLPNSARIVLSLDENGDEKYQPYFIPISGGQPELLNPNLTKETRTFCSQVDPKTEKAVLTLNPLSGGEITTVLLDLSSNGHLEIAKSEHGHYHLCSNSDLSRIVLSETYTFTDTVLYLWEGEALTPIYGTPMKERSGEVKTACFKAAAFVEDDRAILGVSSHFKDHYGLVRVDKDSITEIPIEGLKGDENRGELETIKRSKTGFFLKYNIDGCSRLHKAVYSAETKRAKLDREVISETTHGAGVLQSFKLSQKGVSYSFSSARDPSQLYFQEFDKPKVQLTSERLLGIGRDLLSPGEDASFESHDGLRVSARIYLPSEELNFKGARPLIHYIHGGPQTQEKPDYSWFSMPLIQYFTLNGFAVFVPNVRGSSGYGSAYMKAVDRDWGGQDRLDHIHALSFLKDRYKGRIDVKRAGVMGRSYGGYMTLTLAARHPEYWKAACDLFGPYDLLNFFDRIPKTWRPYFEIAIGHPERDREFLIERSPKTYFDQLSCPLLVIQGKNDPRVIEKESSEIVETLKKKGRDVEYLLFEDEGHDILKFKNKVRCYEEILAFFRKHLEP